MIQNAIWGIPKIKKNTQNRGLISVGGGGGGWVWVQKKWVADPLVEQKKWDLAAQRPIFLGVGGPQCDSGSFGGRKT